MLARLRPHPHRGDVVAAGVVVLALFAVVLNGRFGDEWSDVVRFLVTLVLAAPVIAMAVQAEAGDAVPRPYESVLHVASFVLLLLTLGNLADLLGAGPDFGAGTVVWVGTLLALYSLWFARERNSAIMTMLAAVSAVVVVVAFVEWAFNPDGATTFEWVLFLCAIALTIGAVSQRDARRRHAVSLVDAAGLTILGLGALVVAEQIVSSIFGGFLGGEAPQLTGGPAGWELVLVAFGFGLIAYGAVDRERVPAFLGVLVLVLFAFEALQPGEGGPSLIGWPIVLLVLAGVLLAIGLRPRRELPPEPPVHNP